MSGKTADNEKKLPAGLPEPEPFGIALMTAPLPFDEIFADIQAMYDEKKRDYLASNLKDPELPEKTEQWEKASRNLTGAAISLFRRSRGSIEKQEKALDVIAECKNGCAIRERNLMRQYQMVKRDEPDNQKRIGRLFDAVIKSQYSYTRYDRTQQSYLKRFIEGPEYMTPELRAEKKASAVVAEMMKKVPRDRIYLPARPFPPVRVPEGEPVPYPPEAYAMWKSLPVEDMIYDAEHDEFTVPEGYVSRDGTIDDKSVVWDWKNNTVTMKFVGGEAVTWPFWKPKDTFDVLHEGDWCAEYYIRLYQQVLEDLEPPGTHD